jgi:hypothetical protein
MNHFAVRALDDIVASISDTSASASTLTRAVNVAALGTVCGHAHVKSWLSVLPPADLSRFIGGLFDLALRGVGVLPMVGAADEDARGSLAFDAVAVLGELCRREASEDAASKLAGDRARKLQLVFVTAVCGVTVPFTVWRVLQVVALQAAGDEFTAGAATDMLDALPPEPAPATAPATAPPAAETTPTTTADGGSPLLAGWSKERRERSHDLMFIDDTRQASMLRLPLVCRALRGVCSGCQAAAPSITAFNACSQCRAVFYCSAACGKAHWAAAHKSACATLKRAFEAAVAGGGGAAPSGTNGDAQSKAAAAASSTRASAGASTVARALDTGAALRTNAAARDAFCALFYESRAFLFSQRPDAMSGVSFQDFFMSFGAR